MKHLSQWLIVACVATGMGLDVGSGITTTKTINDKSKVDEILELTQKNYINAIDQEKLSDGAVSGVLSQLDPYSKYLPPQETEKDNNNYDGSYEGIGLKLFSLDDTLVVTEVIPNGPAEQQGVMPSDRILAIDDSDVVGMSPSEATRMLTGDHGTDVKLEVFRYGDRGAHSFKLHRDKVDLPSVDAAVMLTPEIGYVCVNGYIGTTHDEMAQAMKKLQSAGMKQLILDLRGNPGGFVHEAVQMADLFLDGGTADHPRLIVEMKARNPQLNEIHYAHTGEMYEKLPLVILVNHETASAAEIFTGAMQDYDRALVVGETSFGKGLVQRRWTLSDGSAIRLTVGKYHTPSGRIIQRPMNATFLEAKSITADVDSVTQYHTQSGRIVRGGGGITPDYHVEPYEAGEKMKEYLSREVLYPFTLTYLDAHGSEIRRTSNNALSEFIRTFEASDAMLKEFRKFAETKKGKISGESFNRDTAYVKARLKAQIAQCYWGYEGWAWTMAQIEPQIQRAVSLFPEASHIAHLDLEAAQK